MEKRHGIPRWSRWVPICEVSPSGKTLFVCLVCGDTSPAPGKCPRRERRLDDRIISALNDLRVNQGKTLPSDFQLVLPESYSVSEMLCEDVELLINHRRDKFFPEDLLLEETNNKLRAPMSRRCRVCHGYGCQVCLGNGLGWG
jgi:hypothetical protein